MPHASTVKFAIFDLNGCLAFFDKAESRQDAIRKLTAEDESYSTFDPDDVHELDQEECDLLQSWYDGGQKTHEWPFDWRTRR